MQPYSYNYLLVGQVCFIPSEVFTTFARAQKLIITYQIMQKILLSALMSVFVIITDAQCVSNLNFNNWQVGGQPSNGNWVLQGGGTSVLQTVNGAPTMFYSPFDLMNVHISGQFRSTDTDDDWMGFVFSFLNPLGATDSFDCWLFDWKQDWQGSSPRGMALNRVNGLITNYGSFSSHVNTPEFTVVQNDFGGPGWSRGTNHNFDLYLTYTRAIIYVDGVLKFDWQDCFKPGRFGFYNLSQEDCSYSNFVYDLYIDFAVPPQVCRGNAAAFNFTNTCVTTLGQYQSLTWNFGDGTPLVVNNNPTLANVNVTHTYSTAAIYTATLTVVDFNGCSSTSSHTVDVRNPIVLTPTLNQPPCNGGSNGSIAMSASGGFGGYTYLWSNATTQTTLVGATAGTYTITVTDGICNTSAQYTLNQPSALSATTSHTDASCGLNNGTATIVISGGTGPYYGTPIPTSVNWGASFPGTTATGLAPGTFVADFRDANNCSAATQYRETIGSLPCGISSSVSQTNVSCFGGSNGTATLTVSGGSGGSVPGWTPAGGGVFTRTGLAPGTYTYNYSDANPALNFSGSVTITQPSAAMVAQMSTVAVTCAGSNNGQALASIISGGVSPYSYVWSGGQPNNAVASNLSPGPISVIVTDSRGCTATASGTVSGVPTLAVSFNTVMDSCYRSGNGSVTAIVTGGTVPYVYAWNNFNTAALNSNVIQGTYTLTVTDNNGCSLSATATVSGPASAVDNSFTTQHISCNGASTGSLNVTVTGGTPGYTYAWTPNTITGNSATNLAAGSYTWTVTDAFGCITYGIDTILQPDSALLATSTHTNVTCNGANDGTITITLGGGTPPYTYQGLPVPAGSTTLTGLSAGPYSGTVLDALGCSISLTETITEPAALTLSETHVNVLCNGGGTGSIDITPSGGTVPIGFVWNDGILTEDRTSLIAGTYSVTATDNNSCSASISVTITQPSALSITETHVNVLCNGASTGSITTTPAGGVTAYTYIWNDLNVNKDRTNLPAGNYSVTTTDNNLCTASVSVTLTEPTALAVTTSHTNVTCNGANDGTITITVGGGTIPYSFLGNPVPAGTTIIPGLAPMTYSGNVTDGNGCFVFGSETITEPGPQSVTVTGTTAICFGGTQGSATANFVNPNGTVTYNWTGGLSGANISNLSAGTYTVTATDQNSCSQTGSYTVTEPASVVMNVTTTDAACFGGNGNATATPNGGTAPFTYLWSNNATGATVSLPAGSYTVSSTDANTCQQTASLTINQPTEIAVQETHTNVDCFGNATGDITLAVSGGTGPTYTYNWLPNVSSGITATGLVAGTYNVTVTDQASCTKDTFVVITQPAAPLTATSVSQDISCFGANNGTITVTAVGGTLGYTYIWSPNVSTTNVANGLSVGSYSVTVSDLNSCSATTSGTIAEPAQLVLTPSQTDLVCYQVNTGVASVTETGGTPPFTYTWNPNVSTSNTATALTSGIYNLTVTDNSACTATVSYTITEPTQLVATETHSDVLCFGDNTGYIILAVSGATPGYTYQWSPSVSTNDSALNLTPGSYVFTVTDANSCTTSQTVTISSPAQVAVTAVKTDVLCFGGSTGTVTATGTGGVTPYNFAITTDGITYQPSATGLFSSLIASSYWVILSDNNSCVDSVQIAVNEPPLLVAMVDSVEVSCYQYTDGQVVTLASGGVPGYTYSLSTGPQNGTGTFTDLSVGSYSVTVTDVNNCTASDATIVTQPDPVIITVLPTSTTVNLGESILLQASTNQAGIITYDWQPAMGLSCYDCANPLFSGNYSALYTVTVANDRGCSGNASVDVVVVPAYDIFIPNVFTPNGDGANDTWNIFGNLPGIKQIQMVVFNRIGEKVFESTDINFAWDGNYQGVSAPAGVYVYSARIVWLNNHSDSDYQGSVNIMR